MRKYIIIATLALAGFITSCELDRVPGAGIATDEAFETIADAELFRTGMYSLYRNANYNNRRLLSDHQVDIVNAVADFGNRKGLLYLWQDGLATDYDIEAFYQVSYQGITNVNSFLTNIDDIVTEDDAEASMIKQYKGEAYLMRASLFHNLVRYFAKAYNPATASSDLGIAIPLEFDPSGKPARASLEATYQQIQSDLNQAKSHLPDGGAAMAPRLTKDFAHAIQARISLEMQDYPAAIAASDQIIPNYALADTEDKLRTLWTNDTSSEILVRLFVSPNEGRSSSPSYINYSITSRRYAPDFVPSKKVINLYEDGDFRKDVFLVEKDIYVAGVNYEDVLLINKYPGNPEFDSNPNYTDYVHAPKLFMISEAYLIKAEAQARSTGDALGTLNQLRASRGADPVNGDAFALVKEERLREMVAEGQRLLDLKRWGEGLNRTGSQAAIDGGIFGGNTEGPAFLTKPSDDKMFVWEIPANDLRTNENMQPNW